MAPISTSLKKQPKKSDKAYDKRRKLLQALQNEKDASKSHRRRLRRKANPKNQLVTTLDELENELDQLVEEKVPSAAAPFAPSSFTLKEPAKHGKEKLTSKKRQRVLEAESTRLTAVLSDKDYIANPFDAIRRHTANTLLK